MDVKKLTIASLSFASSLVFAGSMGPSCDNSTLSTPCSERAWQVGGKALYLQATPGLGQSNSGVTNQNGRYISYPDQWGWGFQLEAGYQFGKTGDININWAHLSDSAQNFSSGPFTVDQLYPHLGTSSVVLTNNPKWDSVNLEFGQTVIVNDNKHFRFHGGIAYARVGSSNNRAINDPTTPAVYFDEKNITYNGFGPRAGLDFDYAWHYGLAVYANAAVGLLVGQAKTSFIERNTIDGATINAILSDSKTQIVPELEGKLGIKYDYALAQGDLTMDVGWLWIDYLNAQTGFLSEGQNTVIAQDFGLQGLYFGLKWQGNLV